MRRSRLSIAKQALEDIINPIARIQREKPRGWILDGRAAVDLSEDVGYLKQIASQALREIREQGAHHAE